jgi:hypothetical protein
VTWLRYANLWYDWKVAYSDLARFLTRWPRKVTRKHVDLVDMNSTL